MKSLATHGDTVRSCKCLSFPSKSTIISCRQFSNQADVGDEKPRTNIEYAITPSDLYQMNSTLSKLGHAGKIKEMLAVFDEFQTKWRELTSVQYNLVIHYSSLAAITRADPNYLDISRQYYREIKRRKLKITTQTFGTFLTALHSFQQYEEFISVIEFKKKHLPLNMIDYNSLFDVYTKLHKYNDLELNLQEMKSKAPLTIETYRILAKAYVQSKDERKLRDLIQEVSEKFGRLDKSIISIIIAQYLNSNDITKALEVFEKAKANQLVDRVTYNQFIKWFIENDTLRSAMGWYKKLKESNIPPSNDTWTILLWGSARLKIFKYVDSILEDMKGSPIDHKLHNATIHTLGMAGRIKVSYCARK